MPWDAYPPGEGRSESHRQALEHSSALSAAGREVVGLGAMCDLRPNPREDRRRFSFDVSEFAVLDDGERVMLHSERGFTATTNGDDIWARATVEPITRDVLNVVLPDDAEITGEEHSWEWLADLLGAWGIDVAAEQLRRLPYEVVLTGRVRQRLPNST